MLVELGRSAGRSRPSSTTTASRGSCSSAAFVRRRPRVFPPRFGSWSARSARRKRSRVRAWASTWSGRDPPYATKVDRAINEFDLLHEETRGGKRILTRNPDVPLPEALPSLPDVEEVEGWFFGVPAPYRRPGPYGVQCFVPGAVHGHSSRHRDSVPGAAAESSSKLPTLGTLRLPHLAPD